MTIRSRLTIWYGLTFMLLVSVAGFAVWSQVQSSLRASTEEALRVHAADVADDLSQGGSTIDALDPPLPGIFTVLVDPATAAVDAGRGAPPDLPQLPLGDSDRRLEPTGPVYAFHVELLPNGRRLITGSSLAGVDDVAARLSGLLITAGTLCAIGSLIGGWWLAGRALAPIRRLTREADAISPHDLGHRLPTVPQQDEVGRLAATLNRLLARVEDAVSHERMLIAGAAHDLRTPIAALRMRLDGLLRGAAVDGKARTQLEEARQDAIDLGELAAALLGLAEAQAMGLDDEIDDHVLPLLVARVEQEVEWVARERDVGIVQTVDEVSVRISAVRFHQALTNLLSNAVRHGPAGGTVELLVRMEPAVPGPGTVVSAEVADQGPGIPATGRDDIFIPFVARREGSTTHGLGLATAAAAVESQGGEIGYRDRVGGGSVFWFRLPVDRQEKAARRDERPSGGAGGVG